MTWILSRIRNVFFRVSLTFYINTKKYIYLQSSINTVTGVFKLAKVEYSSATFLSNDKSTKLDIYILHKEKGAKRLVECELVPTENCSEPCQTSAMEVFIGFNTFNHSLLSEIVPYSIRLEYQITNANRSLQEDFSEFIKFCLHLVKL